ncbi:dockerin type I repeat-containing protein [Ruminococcus flavefaciens]|uniref:dockerin type I repeat-containing protein n=1 Tax=Ruminococcus flavefaciens TaxID=1265 RepID=UPI0004B5D61C
MSDVPAIAEITPSEGNTYYIFYKDIDTKEIDEIAAQKRHDYIYSLYEQGLSEREVEQKSTDYYQERRLGLVKEAYAEAAASILNKLGIDSSAAFCSDYTPLIICSLTEEQLVAARASENITDITAFKDFHLQPNAETDDAEKAMKLLNACFEENNIDAKCVTSEEYPSYYPPLVIEYVAEKATGKQIMELVEKNNIDKSLFEVVPIINGQKTYWVYDTVNTVNIKGDANCDGKVDLADAIYIMQALANPNKYKISEQGRANADMDGDGLTVDDAQAIQRMLLGLDGSDNDQSIDNAEYLIGNEVSYSVLKPQRLALNCNSFCANGETLNVKMLMGDKYTYNQEHNSYPNFDSEGYPEYSIFATENFKKIDDERLVVNGEKNEYIKAFTKEDMQSLDITGKEGDYTAYYSDTAEIDFSNYPSGTTGCISFSFGWKYEDVNPYDPSNDFDGTSQTMYFYVGENGTGISNNGWEAAQIAYEAKSDNDVMFYDSLYVKWNGKEVMSNLYDKLRKPTDEVLPINFRLSSSPDYDFEYNGKTLAEYANADHTEEMDKLRDLLMYGNQLQYGEAIYTTGMPDGTKRTKEWYE